MKGEVRFTCCFKSSISPKAASYLDLYALEFSKESRLRCQK